jgi:hypothetical protein
MKVKIFIVGLLFLLSGIVVNAQIYGIDAEADGPVFGDQEGLLRVRQLEQQLHNMTIRQDHPRIFVTQETLPVYQQRAQDDHPAWTGIKAQADAGDMINAAFAYLILKDLNFSQAQSYADIAINELKSKSPTAWNAATESGNDRAVAEMSLVFDWVYDALSESDRSSLINTISSLAAMEERNNLIRNEDYKYIRETFHPNTWDLLSWRAWPEIALAHHNDNAEFLYKSRWNYDWAWGDMARYYAYMNDGTPSDGYSDGSVGIGWFLALKSATGVNLVDGDDFAWHTEAARNIVHRMDFGTQREVFHFGASSGAGGVFSYTNSSLAWLYKKYYSRSFALLQNNAYYKWIIDEYLDGQVSSWILTRESFSYDHPMLKYIAQFLFYNHTLTNENPESATWSQWPASAYFGGGNEVYMRTSWADDSAMVAFRVSPVLTKTSHGDFDINTFQLYRNGALSPDSGVYDVYQGQDCYFNYKKTATAHNNILIIDPNNPDGAIKFARQVKDPGGLEYESTLTFNAPINIGSLDDSVFLHNPNANWGDIVSFETNDDYDYAVGKAAKAYSTRLNEYYRSVVFVRKSNDKAYFIVFDRVEGNQDDYQKKWLMHFVTEPQVDGNKISEEIPGHIDTYDGSYIYSENVYGNSAVYVKSILPQSGNIRRIGGGGYEFYIEGSSPQNYPINQSTIDRIEDQMDGPWQEAGTWRIELSPTAQQKRDYFFNIMYIADVNETMSPVSLLDQGSRYGATIDDPEMKVEVLFNKTGEPGGHIKIVKNGQIRVDKEFDTQTQIQTCLSQSGSICTSGQSCSGSWLVASDTNYCCSGTCQAQAQLPRSFSFELTKQARTTYSDTATIYLYTPNTNTLRYTISNKSTNSSGIASNISHTSRIPDGSYDILVKIPYHLPKKLSNQTWPPSSTLNFGELKSGDTNNDNQINAQDLSILLSNWQTSHAISDLNGDGQVNSLDFSYININWNQNES